MLIHATYHAGTPDLVLGNIVDVKDLARVECRPFPHHHHSVDAVLDGNGLADGVIDAHPVAVGYGHVWVRIDPE